MPANSAQFCFRILNPALSLSVDHFVINDLGFSSDYAIDLQVRSASRLTLASLLGKKACLTLYGEQGENFFHGIISQLRTRGTTPDGKEQIYGMVLRSPLYALQLTTSQRVFVNSSIIDVAKTLLKKSGFEDSQIISRLQLSYAPLDFMAQVNETDYDFLYRTLSHWGVFYFFQQDAKQYQFVLADDVRLLNAIASVLSYQPLTGTVRARESVFQMRSVKKVLPTKTLLRDYNPAIPDLALEAEAFSSGVGFGTQYCYGEHALSLNEAKHLARVRQEALDWQRDVMWIETDCPTLQIGQRLAVTDCPAANYNGNYRIIVLEHYGNQEAGKIYAEEKASPTYYNKALCIPADMPYRPLVAKKKMLGYFSAHIESQSDTAYLDENGSYRIRFPFDASNTPVTQASAPVRLLQPYSGKDFGFHFPLRQGTEVLCAFENGDPNRPILLGVLPNPSAPSPVTSENFTQHRLRTQSGNELCMEDCAGAESTQLFTRDKQHLLQLDGSDGQHQIRLSTQQGTMHIAAGKDFITESGENWTQKIGKDHQVTVGDQYRVTTQQGDIAWHATGDIKFTAKQNLSVVAEKNLAISSGQDIRLEVAQHAAVHAENSMVISANNFYVKSGQDTIVGATGEGDIVLAQAGAMVRIAKDGSISLKAKKISIYSQQNNLVGTQGHLGGEGQPAQMASTEDGIAIKLEYRYADGSSSGKAIKDAFFNAMYGRDAMPYFGKTDQQGNSIAWPITAGKFTVQQIQHNQIRASEITPEFIAFENLEKVTWQPPWCEIKLDVPEQPTPGNKPDAAHTFVVTTLFPPAIKNYRDEKKSDLLTEDELHYFKTNGNNATLFIPGYNVPLGRFDYHILSVKDNKGDPISDFNYDPQKVATTYRNVAIIKQLFPDYQFTPSEENANVFNEAFNGTDAHNWFLHMEDNLNVATGQFDHRDYRKYTRLIHIPWCGNLDFQVNYVSAIPHAIKAGKRLVPLIQQLYDAGIEVNIIAHSLGNCVLVNAMNQLGSIGYKNAIAHAFLWQAAVPNDIFSGTQAPTNNNPWYLPHAADAAKKITILYSQNDNVLGPILPRQQEQAEINHSKPVWSELVPALFLTYLNLGSLYEAATWIGVPITDLLNSGLQEQIYQEWIKTHTPIYPKSYAATLEEQAKRDEKENAAFYATLRAKLETAEPEINRQLREASIGNIEPWIERLESAAIHLNEIGIFLFSPQTESILQIAIKNAISFGAIKRLLTLYNTMFTDTEFKPTKALGYIGPHTNYDDPNDPIQKLRKQEKMTEPVKQTPWLWSHSGMKIPSKDLMEHVYKQHIINKKYGMPHFGKYQIQG